MPPFLREIVVPHCLILIIFLNGLLKTSLPQFEFTFILLIVCGDVHFGF